MNRIYKQIIALTGFLVLSAGAYAQSLERAVMGTLGGTSTPSGGPQLLYNSGETNVATLQNGGYLLTQGFEQPVTTVPEISGGLLLCMSTPATLSDTLNNGEWFSSNPSVAVISSTGVVYGLAAGTATISYALYGDTATSTVTIDSNYFAVVSINTAPGTVIASGQTVTFTAVVTGINTSTANYQWVLNSSIIAGETNATYTSGSLSNQDSVSCIVTSSMPCVYPSFNSVIVNVLVEGVLQQNLTTADINLVPNPNKGQFTIKGTTGSADAEVYIEVTDMVGQVVYKNTLRAMEGMLNQQVRLSNTLANGMYLLNLRSGNEKKVFHFIVEQ